MQFSFKYRQFAEALYNALLEDAFYIAMEKAAEETDSPREAMLRYYEYSMLESEAYGMLHVPSDHACGVSVWSKPLDDRLEAKKSSEKKEFIRNFMGPNCLKTYIDIVNFMSEMAESVIGNNFWYLSIVGIAPEFQGKGLGRGLLSDVLRHTDTLKVPTFLETFTPRNMRFYERMGYKAAESFFEPTTQSEYWIMIREPAPE